MKQLDRLLFFQGNRCFFCDQPIPEGEASIEHLIASSNAGSNDDDNCVACCRSLNMAFGNRPYKEKLRALLSHRGGFTCPVDANRKSEAALSLFAPEFDVKTHMAAAVADLQKRGESRPRKLPALRNTVATVFQKKLSEDQLSALLTHLAAVGCIVVHENQVSYNLPPTDA